MACSEQIEIDYDSNKLLLLVEFNFTPGQLAVLHLRPEDCQEGYSDEYEVTGLFLGRKGFGFVPIPEFISTLEESIVNKLESLRRSK